MRKYQISIGMALLALSGTVYQNYRLAEMFKETRGKTRALFGLIEIAQWDKKLYLGVLVVVSLVFGIISLRKNENRMYALLSICLSGIALVFLYLRLWTWMI